MRVLGVLLAVGLAIPPVALAGNDDDQRTSSSQARPAPDFLFGQPRATVGVRGTLTFPRAGSDLFDFFTSHLTIDKDDLRAGGFATDVGIRLTPRLELVAGYEGTRSSHDSEYRDFVDNEFLPIEQSTTLNTAAITTGLRFAIVEPGRRISQLAWIPRVLTPHVGAGGGFMRYTLLQRGDFVDFADLGVFRTVFESKKWTPSAYLAGGVDARIFRRWYLTTEGRYVFAAADLDSDFVGFEPIDLSGFRLSAGINVKF